MNLAPVVTSFALSISVTRYAAGAYDSHGRYTSGSSSVLSMQAAVHPATSRDLQVLPEGMRTEQSMVFYAAQELRTASAPGGAPADRITFGGSVYEVQHAEDWSAQAGYWRAVGIKLGQ